MYLVLIAWLYVTLMMALAEAASPNGSILGAIMTFVLYGLLPMGIVGYILGTPARKRAIKAREQEEQAAYEAAQAQSAAVSEVGTSTNLPRPGPALTEPDAGSQPAAAAEQGSVAPVRKEP